MANYNFHIHGIEMYANNAGVHGEMIIDPDTGKAEDIFALYTIDETPEKVVDRLMEQFGDFLKKKILEKKNA